jgi:hypothetical protein
MEQEIIALQDEIKKIYYEDMKLIRKLEWNLVHTSRYFSRKSWRMEILTDYMASMQIAIDLAFGGEIGMSESARIMASAGVKGATKIRFFNIEHDNDNFFIKMYCDIGAYTTADKTYRNDSTVLIQTRTRVYLVSEHYVDGTTLGMQEVRVVKAITPTCMIMVHTALNSYKVVNGGNITCYRFGIGKRQYTLAKGNFLHLEDRDTCKNECIEVGYRGFNNKHQDLPAQPNIQPADLQHFYQEIDIEKLPSPISIDKAHQISHDMLAGDIRQNEDMLVQINEEQNVVRAANYSGYVGSILSIIVIALILAVCIRFKCQKCKRQKKETIVKMKTFRQLNTDEAQDEEEAE